MTQGTFDGPNRAEQGGVSTPSDFGDVRREFQALLSGCGVYDLSSRSKIVVGGADRVRWLNGMATNNVRDLATGHGVYAFLLNAQGRIQADLYIFQRGDSLLVDTEGAQREKVLELFDRYIIADDVEISDISDSFAAVGLTGPASRDVLAGAGIAVPQLTHLQFAELEWRRKQITLLQADEEIIESWQIWVALEHHRELLNALIESGGSPVGSSALNLFRVSRGIPQFGVDIRDRDLPQETGQTRALNFTKGCYLGQEIVERIRSRGAIHRQFTGFEVEGELPQPGTKLLADEKEVGELTSCATLPLPGGSRLVALGYLRREAAAKELRAGTAKVIPVPLPIT